MGDQRVVEGGGVVDQEKSGGETDTTPDEREEGDSGTFKSHGVVHAVNGEGRVHVPLAESFRMDFLGRPEQSAGGGKLSSQSK